MIFMRPLFLLLLFVIPIFFHLRKKSFRNNPWKKIINPEFLPFLMVKQNQTKEGKTGIIWISLLWTILSIALAGPAFEKAPTTANENTKGTVLIVDLNSLNQTTLTQLKIKLSEVIKKLNNERIGLVLYDTKGYVALPMTQDSQILQEIIPVLDPSVLPNIGNKPEEGFKTAIELLKNNNLDTGRILFFTGGIPSEKETIALLEKRNYSVGVLGLGNGEKTPILTPDGQFRRDEKGNVIFTELNKKSLSKLGVFKPWQANHLDIETLIKNTTPIQSSSLFNQTNNLNLTIDTYKDLGIYLLIFSMPFIALFYRKGFFILIIFFITTTAQASLWLRDDQILYNSNEKAVQAYKNKDYLSALAGFKNDTSDTGLYNQANATAHMGHYQEAINLYKQALTINPNHKEARFNKEYLEQMMKNNQSSSQNKEQQNNQKKQNESNNNKDNKNDTNSSEQEEQKNTDNLEQNTNDTNTLSAQNQINNTQQTEQNENDESQKKVNSEKSNSNKSENKASNEKTNDKENKEVSSPQEKNQEEPTNASSVEETENKNPIDQTSQEIFKRLKKDPSILLRYRLHEQNRRKP